MSDNIIYQGDSLSVLKTLPSCSINMCMTSPPYWALRDYGSDVESIWDEVCLKCKKPFTKFESKSCDCEKYTYCEHDFEMVERQLHSGTLDVTKTVHHALKVGALKTDWKTKDGFCNKCGAWKGQLGLEPTFDLYIKHLCDIFDEVKRVLRDDGTCWVNIGDTYASTPTGNMGNQSETDGVYKRLYERNTQGGKTEKATHRKKDFSNIPTKSLVMIPQRFAIEMVKRGWILRNVIIWHKPNCMPCSVKDRFTVDFEKIFYKIFPKT